MQTEDELNSVDGIPLMTEAIGYSADDMVACSKCAKPNPPNRLNCLYCGSALELPAEVAAGLQFRPSEIEDWEPGVNLVIVDSLDPVAVDALWATIALDDDLLASLVGAEVPIPLLRLRTDEADEIGSRVSAAGVPATAIHDTDLAHQQPPRRLKGLRFGSDSVELLLFNSDESVIVEPEDVVLIVVGAIFKSSSEATLKTKGKETKHVDEKFASSDHGVIDIFTASDRQGFRIVPHGFDFSCLGGRMSLLAVENFATLKDLLPKTFPDSVFDDSYAAKMPILDRVWPRRLENTSRGMQRVGWRLERSVGESISNEEQFTRYARMRRQLI